MNDETTETTEISTDATKAVPLSEDHAVALDLAASAQTPEDKAAADALVQEAVDNAHTDVPEVEKQVTLREGEIPDVDAAASAANPVLEVPPEAGTERAHHILTTIEDEIESLLHSPLALVAWVKSKVAEAKAKL